MLRVEFLREQTLIVGVSTQEVNLGKALGKSTCESKGKKAGLGRGRNPTARQSPGSAPADAAESTRIHHCVMWVHQEGGMATGT